MIKATYEGICIEFERKIPTMVFLIDDCGI